jgi:hypothetical protein
LIWRSGKNEEGEFWLNNWKPTKLKRYLVEASAHFLYAHVACSATCFGLIRIQLPENTRRTWTLRAKERRSSPCIFQVVAYQS